MKTVNVLCLLALMGLSLVASELYTDKWDNINVDEVITNQRLLESYIKCMLDQGPCTADGNEFKSNIKESLENDCTKCTEAQKNLSKRLMKHLINEVPAYWQQLCDKYDPERKYVSKYEKEFRTVKA